MAYPLPYRRVSEQVGRGQAVPGPLYSFAARKRMGLPCLIDPLHAHKSVGLPQMEGELGKAVDAIG